jgi:hypothetical protein
MPSTPAELHKALKTFRKRLNASQLEEDSKLGRGPIGHRKDKIVSMQPPPGFGRAIWDELVALGYLKNDGGGFFQLTDKQWQEPVA